MRVRVKKGMTGFFGGNYKKEDDEFTIEARGDISIESQFSKKWMEEVKVKSSPEPKASPKKKAKKETQDK